MRPFNDPPAAIVPALASCVKRPSHCPIWWNNVVCWRNPKQLPLLLMPIVHYTGTWWQAKWVCNSISLSSVMPLWRVRPSLNAKCLPSRSLRWVSWAGHQCSYFRKKSLKKLCFIPPTRRLVHGNWKVSTGSGQQQHGWYALRRQKNPWLARPTLFGVPTHNIELWLLLRCHLLPTAICSR